jgi:hypothetical protein
MRGLVAIMTLVGLLMCAGCFTTGAKDVPVSSSPPPPVQNLPPPVRADQITPQNARQECQRLEAEISHDEQLLMAGALPN